MKFLYTAPRYHTNQVPIVRGLKGKGHEVRYFVVFVGATEDHTDCEPLVLKPSRTTVREKKRLEKRMSDGDVESVIGGHFIPDYSFLKRAFEAYMPDVVICREKTPLTLCVHALCSKHQIPCILYDQEPVKRFPSTACQVSAPRRKRLLLKRIVTKLSRTINPDQRMLQTMRQTTAFPSVRLSPVKYSFTDRQRNSVFVQDDHAYYVPLVYEAPNEVKNREYFLNGVLNMLFVGKYRVYKNIPVLLSALKNVKEKDSWHIVFVGQAASEEEKQYKQAVWGWIVENGMEQRITMLDNYPYSQMRELYKTSDVLILPSKKETYGMAIVEAMAHGLTVICSDTCGAAFCNLEAGGIIVKQDDVDSLKGAIESCLDTPSVIETKGTDSYMYVKNNLSFEKYYEAFSSLLRSEYHISLY